MAKDTIGKILGLWDGKSIEGVDKEKLDQQDKMDRYMATEPDEEKVLVTFPNGDTCKIYAPKKISKEHIEFLRQYDEEFTRNFDPEKHFISNCPECGKQSNPYEDEFWQPLTSMLVRFPTLTWSEAIRIMNFYNLTKMM